MMYPNRAQPSHIASANGKKGARKSPWGRGSHVKTKANFERKAAWLANESTEQ